MELDLTERLKILVGAAKFDVSCSSSGSNKNWGKGMGSVAEEGICHTFTADGRCISLLKILMSNHCVYNCEYCESRRSSDCKRARVSAEEVCEIVMNFYKRNYIEGLFLSSAVDGCADRTMEILSQTVIKLRKIYGFRGYIHLKGIPGADMRIITNVSKYVDRMSFNIELPSEKSLKLLAPQKSKNSILTPMRMLGERYKEEKKSKGLFKRVIPAGQTTQMIVGASQETDGQIVNLAFGLYSKYAIKRVYFSSFTRVTNSDLLPKESQGKLREHRLYQADWLMRFYGFYPKEIATEGENLPLDIDPKENWALKNMGLFPVEVNIASYEMLLRTPGIGRVSAFRIIEARRFGKLDFDSLKRLGVVLKRARHFITANGKFFGYDGSNDLRAKLSIKGTNDRAEQMSIFDKYGTEETLKSIATGEV